MSTLSKDKEYIRLIKFFMLGSELFSIIFIPYVIYYTTSLICEHNSAYPLLILTSLVPKHPRNLLILSCLCALSFTVTFFLRQYVIKEKKNTIYFTIIIDTIVILIYMTNTNMNYNGLILWIIANLVYYIESKNKYLIIALGIVVYVLTDFSIIKIYTPLFSIKDYIGYYQGFTKNALLMIYYGISALNLAAFIIFCIYYIQQQKGIIEKVNALYLQLREANQELKQYAEIKEKMGETKERNRLAREIHDTLGHTLTGISFGIDACLTVIDKDKDSAKKQLEVISNLAKDGIADVRLSVSSLRADALEQYPLKERIIHLLNKTKKATGVEILITFSDSLKLESYEENAIFRLVQESVTNAIRHGKATLINILFTVDEENLIITIVDNGIGCENFNPGFGLMNMQERITMLHGKISFTSSANGFYVKAKIPVRK